MPPRKNVMGPTLCTLGVLVLALVLVASRSSGADEEEETPSPVPPSRIEVPLSHVEHDDGDSLAIRWPQGREIVRILGIDAPEVMHLEHDIPYDQPFGPKAAGFLEGALAVAGKVELLRSGRKDPYGRTLGYLFLDGKNYSVLLLRARLAVETISYYGDGGLPDEAARCLAAGRDAGPVPFEAPHRYRARMRELSARLREEGRYPGAAPDEER